MFFKSGREPSHILHLAEEAFNDVAHGVEVLVVWDGVSCVALGWNDGESTFFSDLAPDIGTAISFIGDDGERGLSPIHEAFDHFAVVGVTSADLKAVRAALCVYSNVNFACATAA